MMKQRHEAIVKHPYLERQEKHFMILKNVTTVESVQIFMTVLDIAEKLCTCSEEYYKKRLPIFKQLYSLVGDADTEVKFIEAQRGKR